MANYLRLGKLIAAHGLKGELVLKHDLGKKSSLKGLQTIFIEEKKNTFLPWFLITTRIKNDEETYIKLEGVEVRESAIKLTQKNFRVSLLYEPYLDKRSQRSQRGNMATFYAVNGECFHESPTHLHRRKPLHMACARS